MRRGNISLYASDTRRLLFTMRVEGVWISGASETLKVARIRSQLRSRGPVSARLEAQQTKHLPDRDDQDDAILAEIWPRSDITDSFITPIMASAQRRGNENRGSDIIIVLSRNLGYKYKVKDLFRSKRSMTQEQSNTNMELRFWQFRKMMKQLRVEFVWLWAKMLTEWDLKSAREVSSLALH